MRQVVAVLLLVGCHHPAAPLDAAVPEWTSVSYYEDTDTLESPGNPLDSNFEAAQAVFLTWLREISPPRFAVAPQRETKTLPVTGVCQDHHPGCVFVILGNDDVGRYAATLSDVHPGELVELCKGPKP